MMKIKQGAECIRGVLDSLSLCTLCKKQSRLPDPELAEGEGSSE